jgi:putative chitinase
MSITLEQLQKIYTHAPADRLQKYLVPLNAALDFAQINTPLRLAAFLAQIGHESMELRYMSEVWGPTPQQLKYERPVGAELVKPPTEPPLWQRLGNTEPGDGFAFRGAGPIEVTGRANFRAAGKVIGEDLEANPDRAHTPEIAFKMAAWFWSSHGLNALADRQDFDHITRIINGGYNGKAQRDAYYEVAKKVLGV